MFPVMSPAWYKARTLEQAEAMMKRPKPEPARPIFTPEYRKEFC